MSLGPPEAGTSSPTRRSQPSSTLDASQTRSKSNEDTATPQQQTTSAAVQTLSTAAISINYEFSPVTTHEASSLSRGIQTVEPLSPQRRTRISNSLPSSDSDHSPSRKPKRLSRREREKEEELRLSLRREIEEELKAIQDPAANGTVVTAQPKYPARALTDEELNAVTSSEDFLDFVDRSSKVIEKALDEEYDILVDYGRDGLERFDEDEDEGYGSSRGKRERRMKEVVQFYDERWSRKRMVSDLGYSTKVRRPGLNTVEKCLLIMLSFLSCFSLHIPKTPLPLKILQDLSKYGICIYTQGPNTCSMLHPMSSQLASRLSIHLSSSAVPTVDRSSYGTRAQSRPYQFKRHL